MDTTAQNTAQNSQQMPPQQPVAQPPDTVQAPQTQPQVTPQPVSVPSGKEGVAMPVVMPQEKWVEETAPVAKIEQELQEAGVEASQNEVMTVSPEVAESGVTPTGTAAPVPEEPTLKLPMTEEKAKGILKMHKKVKDSVTWLAMLVVRQMQMFRVKEKGEAHE